MYPQIRLGLKMVVFIFMAFLLTTQVGEAARIYIGVGTTYGSNVVYIPGHWYRGYWVPGQYVEYAGPPPGYGYVWYQGGFDGGHHWRHGHWGHHHHH